MVFLKHGLEWRIQITSSRLGFSLKYWLFPLSLASFSSFTNQQPAAKAPHYPHYQWTLCPFLNQPLWPREKIHRLSWSESEPHASSAINNMNTSRRWFHFGKWEYGCQRKAQYLLGNGNSRPYNLSLFSCWCPLSTPLVQFSCSVVS